MALRSLLNRIGGQRAGPTAALYFTDALDNLIGKTRPIQRVTPTLYAAGSAAVVIRYAGPRELSHLAGHGYARVVLIMDDDLFALASANGLPADYRARLLAFRDGHLMQLLPHVTHVVAPSPAILAGYPGKHRLMLAPAQVHLPASLSHHRMEGPLTIIATGTRSHLCDIAHIGEAIATFLREHQEAHLTTLLGGHAPKALAGLRNARHLPALSWQNYRRFAAERRFHVALAPALDTAFNQARSAAKIHDHAALGAAGLFSARAPFSVAIKHEENGLLLDDDPALWLGALRKLAASRGETARLAAGGQALSARLGGLDRVRRFWVELLALHPGS